MAIMASIISISKRNINNGNESNKWHGESVSAME
jgi:hypothetical protein